jgi:hypothetical protein
LEPIREARRKISDGNVKDILREGAKKARRTAAETMIAVRSLVDFAQE